MDIGRPSSPALEMSRCHLPRRAAEYLSPAFGLSAKCLSTQRPQTLAKAPIASYITGYIWGDTMGRSQKRAIQNYRTRLNERGLARFEVLGRDADRDLIRSLARRLAEDSPDASRLRAAVSQTIAGEPPKKGGILAALRRSPLVGADLDLDRPREEGRKVQI
jgi:hypothetical protein